MRGRVRGREGWDAGRRGGGSAVIDVAAGWSWGPAFPSGWKARRKGAARMRHSSALSKTCVFDLTRGRVVGEDQIAKSFDRPRSAGTWRPPIGRSFVFLGFGVPRYRAPLATPRTAFPSDPETGPLVNPTCAGKLKLSGGDWWGP